MMQEQWFTVRFDSPPCLGNAGQFGQWPPPPLKTLLHRCWWVATDEGSARFRKDGRAAGGCLTPYRASSRIPQELYRTEGKWTSP